MILDNCINAKYPEFDHCFVFTQKAVLILMRYMLKYFGLKYNYVNNTQMVYLNVNSLLM